MAPLYPSQDTFVRGELSPRLHARASLDLYRAGLSKCENFITLPHGGIRKRGGTYFAGEVKYSSQKTRLIPFVFSEDQAYAIELGELYLRIYAYGARVGSVELATPWPSADLNKLQFYQSADVMWVSHESYPTQVLTRLAHASWTLEDLSFTDGPFGPVNTTEARKMYISAAEGVATITANFPAFSVGDIDRLVRIDMKSYVSVPPWEAQRQYASGPANPIGIRSRYDGNVYVATAPSTTLPEYSGSTPPTHTKGEQWDGPNNVDASITGDDVQLGILWRYLHSGYGVARITTVVSDTQVTVQILSRFPEEVVGAANASDLFRLGAFSSSQRNAAGVSVFEERLFLSQRFSIFGSKTGDFDSYRLGEKDDDALEFLQAGGGQANDIVWIADADGALVIGTTGGIRSLSGSGLDEALTPSSFKNRKSRAFGCAPTAPVDAGTSFIYLTRSRRVLAELTRDSSGRFSTEDISQVSEHIPKKGVVSLAYQNDPDPILWFPLDTGELAGFTHQPSQEVRGTHRHLIGGMFEASDFGEVESATVTPGLSGADDVWMVVKRTIGGVTRRYIEIMQEAFEYRAVETAFQVDCGLSYSGAAIGTVTGLGHLNGEEVDVLADGRVHRGLTVSGGAVTLPEGQTASLWHVGLPFVSEADTLELDVGGRDGSMIGRRKKIGKVILSLLETDTSGLKIQSFQRGRWEQVKVPTVKVDNGKATLFTGNVDVPVDDSWEGQCRVRILHDAPTPCTIRAMTTVFEGEP